MNEGLLDMLRAGGSTTRVGTFLSEKQIDGILRLLKLGIKVAVIARRFGVSPSHIHRIRQGQR